MRMCPSLKQGLHWFGSALAIVGVVFVIVRLNSFHKEIDVALFNAVTWTGIAVFTFVYGLATLMLALAWWNLLEYLGISVSRRWAIETYGVTQLAKYAPGNIFHLASRQAVGVAAGLPGWPMAKSTAWELVLLSVSGGIFGILTLPRWLPLLPTTLTTLGLALTVGTVAFAICRYWGKSMVRAFVWQCGFLVINGLIFSGVVCWLVVKSNSIPFIELCGAYILAWLIGLLTPGAPAGVGVRELTLLFLFDGVINETDLLMAVVLGRMITVMGDFCFFGFASLLKSKVSVTETQKSRIKPERS